MALSRQQARVRICIAVASQLDDIDATTLIAKRENGDVVEYKELGIDEEGRLVFVRPLNVVFQAIPLRWGVAEIRSLASIKATEDRALEKSKE